MKRFIFIASISILLAACAAQGVTTAPSEGNVLTAEQVLTDSPLVYRYGEENAGNVDMLAISPAMADFLENRVRPAGSDTEQLRQLAYSIMRSGEFSLAYQETTGTAAETFASRRGNCMAFTNMFVAMARYLGLDARFQEVEVPQSWSMSVSGDAFLFSQHINVYIDLKQGRWREVDFNIYDFDHEMETRIVSDQRARAHYHNNVGAEAMLAGDTGLALNHFQQALYQDRSFAPAWINLGILHRRAQLPDYAEVAFLEALDQSGGGLKRMSDQTLDVGWMPSRVNDTSLLAMSNLASLYEEQGEPERAEQYFSKVHSHRMKNPYYRYQVASIAFEEGDYESAIKDLKFAVRRQKNEDRFYYLLSMSYLMDGDRAKAETWMGKAEEVARSNGEKQRYGYKLEQLRKPDGQ